jgi:hypothetical protein
LLVVGLLHSSGIVITRSITFGAERVGVGLSATGDTDGLGVSTGGGELGEMEWLFAAISPSNFVSAFWKFVDTAC